MPRIKMDAETDSKPMQRLSLPIRDDGTLDWERIRGSTAEKLLGVLQTDQKLAAEYDTLRGLSRKEPDDDAQMDLFGGVTEENVHSLIDTIGKANAAIFQFVAAKWIKHPLPFMVGADNKRLPLVIEPDILQKFEFTDKQHKELDPRGYRIAKKYQDHMPEWLKKHLDIYLFASMFLAYSAENAKLVLTAQINRDVHRAQEAFATKAAAAARRQPKDSDVPRSQPANGEDKNPPLEFMSAPPPETDAAPGGETPRA